MSRPMKGPAALIVTVLAVLACETASAQDDGPRAYWKGMSGTNVVGFQYLPMNAVIVSDAFDPAHYMYPQSDITMNLVLVNYSRHGTLFGRAASFSAFLMGGNLDVEFFAPGTGGKQASHGFGDPSVQVAVNLVGASSLPSFYHMSKYEPKVSLDIALLGAVPIGKYSESSAVNMGLNRWWGRVALPFTYYLGPYVPGYRSSVEVVPSVFLFAPNNNFVGSELKNDPLYQIEAHVTRDFTAHFFASVDFLYRHGARSTIDGTQAGESIDLVTAGFTLDWAVSENAGVRFSYQPIVAGGTDMDGDMVRMMSWFGWHALVENVKKLGGG